MPTSGWRDPTMCAADAGSQGQKNGPATQMEGDRASGCGESEQDGQQAGEATYRPAQGAIVPWAVCESALGACCRMDEVTCICSGAVDEQKR